MTFQNEINIKVPTPKLDLPLFLQGTVYVQPISYFVVIFFHMCECGKYNLCVWEDNETGPTEL